MIENPFQLSIGILLVIIFGVLSLKLKIVDFTGFLAGLVVGWSIYIFGDWRWFIIVLTFHLAAGFFTKYGYKQKREKGAAEEKGGARAWRNIIANGGVTALFAFAEGFTSLEYFFAGFLGAVSTATADTLATEIGLLHSDEPRLITDLKKRVPPGTSGGVSLLGEIATILGAGLIGVVAWILNPQTWSLQTILTVTLIAGFLGCTTDSLVGATVQAKYRCSVCGKITEKRHHCDRPSIYSGGMRAIDNNTVNLLATLFGACLGIFVLHMLE